MIVVEGADLVGKTTLCRELQRLDPSLQYTHLGQEAASFTLQEYLDRIKPNALIDRFFLSDIVYCRLLRGGKTLLSPAWTRIIEAKMRLIGAVTIVLCTSGEKLQQRYAERGDKLLDIEGIQYINEQYWYLADYDIDFHGRAGTPSATDILKERRLRREFLQKLSV